MAEKTFKTTQEQVALLRSRGLSIPDERRAEEFLLRNNYYRVSGYSLTLRNHDVFYPSATFQNIVDIYQFDYELRHVLLRFLEIIEVTIKSVYAYEFTKAFGATGYLDDAHFEDKEKYENTMEKAKAQCKRRHHSELYIKHFKDELHQAIPLWAYVDLLTISDISFLYAATVFNIQKAIAQHFGLTMKDGGQILGRFLHSLTIVRNLCAHGSRLFNRLFERKPSLKRDELMLLIKNDDGTVDNAHLFGFVLIMRRLLTKPDFMELKQGIVSLTVKYPFVAMRYYGFPTDWADKI